MYEIKDAGEPSACLCTTRRTRISSRKMLLAKCLCELYVLQPIWHFYVLSYVHFLQSQSYACLKPKGHQTLLYLFYFRLGKGLLSQDFYFVSRIINYKFGLSAFIFPKSGVKITFYVTVYRTEVKQRLMVCFSAELHQHRFENILSKDRVNIFQTQAMYFLLLFRNLF